MSGPVPTVWPPGSDFRGGFADPLRQNPKPR